MSKKANPDDLTTEQIKKIKEALPEFRPKSLNEYIQKSLAYGELFNQPIPSDECEADLYYLEARQQILKQQAEEKNEVKRQKQIALAEKDAGVPYGYLSGQSKNTQQSITDASTQLFTTYFDAFITKWTDNNPDKVSQRVTELKGALKRFRMIMGDDLQIRDLTPEVFEDFYDGMKLLPARMDAGRKSKNNTPKPMTYAEAQAKVTIDGKNRMSDLSRKDNIKAIKKCTKRLVKDRLLSQDPLSDFEFSIKLGSETKARHEQRLAFTSEDVVALLDCPEFKALKTGSESYVYWMLLLMAYSGMRNSEALFLTHSSLRKCPDTGIYFLRLEHERCPESDVLLRRVKTDNSIRNVPLHEEILKEGFIDHIQNADKSTPYILHQCAGGWNSDDRAKLKQSESTIARKVLEAAGIYQKGTKTAYSLRHAVCSQLFHDHGLNLIEIGSIVGHIDENESTFMGNSMTMRYIGNSDLKSTEENINKICYK